MSSFSKCLCLSVLLLLTVLAPSVRAQAAGSAAPGRAVGHVFLGMDRADVWKILGRPKHTSTVPHGMDLYGEDDWTARSGSPTSSTLTVVSLHDKVIQIEFDSPRFVTPDGLSAESTLAQVRRRHPSMTVRPYTLDVRFGEGPGYYLDDVRAGISFTVYTGQDVGEEEFHEPPHTIIIHRPGHRAVPIYEGHWSDPASPGEDPVSLRLVRSWFTPRGPRKK